MDTHETKVYFAILLGGIVLAIILIFFIATIIRHQRKSVQLYEQQINTEITTLELERKRVSSDLHDDLAPFISAIKLQVNSLNTIDHEDLSIIETTSKYLDDVFMKIREISNNLVPNVLIRKGLLIALKEYVQNLKTPKNFSIKLQFDTSELGLEAEKEIHVYRIVHEVLHNCMKHAQATEFIVQFERKDTLLRLRMSDNGKGFDFYQVSNESIGSGLKNIVRRVDIMNGDLYIDKPLQGGVTYTIDIPLKNVS